MASEQFISNIPLPEDLVGYYSNKELAKSGWTSYDAFDGPDGVHYVFSQESGAYLFVEYLTCQSDTEMTCVAVWKSSEPVVLPPAAPEQAKPTESLDAAAATTFSKTSPVDAATGLSSPVTLKWQSLSGAEKYTYCLDTSACSDSGDWTSTYNTSISVSGLNTNTKYFWQVRALTCGSCDPKKWVYANSGTEWSFTVAASNVAIVGNAGVSAATLSYVVSGATKTVTASSTGAYSITVPYNWSGTVTPSMTNYRFTPSSATFNNLTVSQTIQNFAATPIYYISGNTGQPGVALSYTDGIAKTVTSDASANYTIATTAGWSGTVTPSHPCYTFNPPSRNYTNLSGNQTLQNYAATFFLSPTCKNLDVTIGGTVQGSYYVYSNQVVTASYASLQGGPVKVSSRYNTKLFTSQRVISGSSFNEVMGYPTDQLTTDYWFPWYDNTTMDTWILVGNPSASSNAAVDIYIGGIKQNSYVIAPGKSITPRFALQAGPVRVVSTNGAKIFTSERTVYKGAFNEVMGYPTNQLTTDYWFPWYDNTMMDTWVLVGNSSTSTTAAVDIYIDGSKVGTYSIPKGGIVTPRFNLPAGGPVRIVSTNGAKIFTSERTLYGDSFNEVMGYPASQFTTEYWYPWYDNVAMDTWLLVGNPTGSTAKVDIYIGGVKRNSYSIPAGGQITPRFDLNSGPVRVVSTNSVNIFTSERALYSTSFNEVMGYPGNKLTTEYWFPWYDNTTMDTDILVGRP